MFRRTRNKNQSESENFNPNLETNLKENLDNIRKMLDNPQDLMIRKIPVGNTKFSCALVYISALSDDRMINEQVIKNIQLVMAETKQAPSSEKKLLGLIQQEVLSVGNVNKVESMDDTMLAVLSGNAAFFIDGLDTPLILGTQGWKKRAIKEPIAETLIRGPRDGFIEDIATNIAHIRRRIRDPNLRFKPYRVGRRSKSRMMLAYMDGIAHPALIKEVDRRLQTIDLDDVPESGYIEQWIQDSFLSPFPQIGHTERPDAVTAALMQGKFAILLDGTPFVLTAPMSFANYLMSPEDYYNRWMFGTVIRVLRYFAAFNAVFLPSLYIALLSYAPGMIPSQLAFSIAATREGVPYPAFVEAFLMEVTMELLREAGIRLPKPVGQTIGIVGGLVIGEAAIQAGVVSPIMVMVVALTAISSFTIPSFNFALSFRLLRFGAMIAATMFGFYGIILFYILINIHVSNLKSFGVPYTTPAGPMFWHDWRDFVLRAPLLMLKKRPKFLQPKDVERH
ncbi:MAG TPA: spore germination protein [Bacillales bacterium]